MRRRFGVPLTAALLLVLFMARPFWPFAEIEPYYVLAGLSTLWAVIDSIRLQVSKHGSSPLLSPVALAAWMLIAWPLAFPWYLKVHYLVSNGESADNVGSFAAIRLAFMGMLVAGGAFFVGGAAVIGKYFPGVRNYLASSLLVSREMSRQFGGSTNLSLSDNHELVITMGQERPDDSLANQRFARQVARYARTHFPGADSLSSIEVVLQGSAHAKDRGRYKWTIAELNAGAPASSAAVQVAADADKPRPRGSSLPSVNVASVTPAGSPAGSPASSRTPTRRPVPTHAFARLAAADPAVRWVADSALVADVDCDGAADTVIVAISGVRAALSLESLDWEPADRGLEGLTGFHRSPTCKGLSLADGDSKAVHIFWSHSTKHVEWYQR